MRARLLVLCWALLARSGVGIRALHDDLPPLASFPNWQGQELPGDTSAGDGQKDDGMRGEDSSAIRKFASARGSGSAALTESGEVIVWPEAGSRWSVMTSSANNLLSTCCAMAVVLRNGTILAWGDRKKGAGANGEVAISSHQVHAVSDSIGWIGEDNKPHVRGELGVPDEAKRDVRDMTAAAGGFVIITPEGKKAVAWGFDVREQTSTVPATAVIHLLSPAFRVEGVEGGSASAFCMSHDGGTVSGWWRIGDKGVELPNWKAESACGVSSGASLAAVPAGSSEDSQKGQMAAISLVKVEYVLTNQEGKFKSPNESECQAFQKFTLNLTRHEVNVTWLGEECKDDTINGFNTQSNNVTIEIYLSPDGESTKEIASSMRKNRDEKDEKQMKKELKDLGVEEGRFANSDQLLEVKILTQTFEPLLDGGAPQFLWIILASIGVFVISFILSSLALASFRHRRARQNPQVQEGPSSGHGPAQAHIQILDHDSVVMVELPDGEKTLAIPEADVQAKVGSLDCV